MGFPLLDALHPVGRTFAFEVMKTTQKISYGSLPAPALRLHHIFHVGRPSGITSVWQTGYWGSRVGEGRCHSTLLVVGLGLVLL